jgi:hypothetical protein
LEFIITVLDSAYRNHRPLEWTRARDDPTTTAAAAVNAVAAAAVASSLLRSS